MKKIELLAPAGDYECFLAAIAAGADAVYLAGKSFGARAFAGNFDEEELINALHYAHLNNRKIYLTCNTLIKEREWDNLYPFLNTLYCNGLDGIIIQDVGLISFLKKVFPHLEIHISTQLTVTDVKSVKLLYDFGATRIVPARELSLEELKAIKSEIPVELETFAHGALCYCYSGQCLFSSFLGGRSGNRGKCAQPCRLPYHIGKEECYPLSLKDLCTVDILDKLITAGVSSLKIEGRMKSAQYVAGVTAIYRKYIDEYYIKGIVNVTKEDHKILNHLYIRSQSGTGYYEKYNGKDMVTMSSPSYLPVDENVNSKITNQYCSSILRTELYGKLKLELGKEAVFEVTSGTKNVTVYGDVVMEAQKHPLSNEEINKQLYKTGASFFIFHAIEIKKDDNCFMTVKQLNEIRRRALEAIQQEILSEYERKTDCFKDEIAIDEKGVGNKALHVSVMSSEQLYEAFCFPLDRIYIPADLFVKNDLSIADILKKEGKQEIYLTLPRIIRRKDDNYLKEVLSLLNVEVINGVLVNNLEEIDFLKENHYTKKIALNHTLYIWNKHSFHFYNKLADSFCAPLELSRNELNDIGFHDFEIVAYGHLPMMVTANCIKKTLGKCSREDNNSFHSMIKDRFKKEHPVYCNCIHCYNEIFNAVPLSLHNEYEKYIKDGYHIFRLDFTVEDKQLSHAIMNYYLDVFSTNKKNNFPLKEYTTGHSVKGAL